MSVTSTPTLDQIAEHPELVMQLPHPMLRVLIINAIKVQSLCLVALIGLECAPVVVPDPDQLIPAKEAAKVLGMSPLTLLRRRGRAPYREFVVPTGQRAPRFSLKLIQQYIKLHAGTRSGPRMRTGKI